MDFRKLFLILFVAGMAVLYSRFLYVSPGLRMSWDFRNHFMVSPKISLGTPWTSGINSGFHNITIGVKQPMGKAKDTVMPSIYVEYQAGVFTEYYKDSEYDSDMGEDSNLMIYGGSVGLAFHRDKNRFIVGPKFSAFGGFLAFLIVDADFTKELGFNGDAGCQVVLPFLWFGVP